VIELNLMINHLRELLDYIYLPTKLEKLRLTVLYKIVLRQFVVKFYLIF